MSIKLEVLMKFVINSPQIEKFTVGLIRKAGLSASVMIAGDNEMETLQLHTVHTSISPGSSTLYPNLKMDLFRSILPIKDSLCYKDLIEVYKFNGMQFTSDESALLSTYIRSTVKLLEVNKSKKTIMVLKDSVPLKHLNELFVEEVTKSLGHNNFEIHHFSKFINDLLLFPEQFNHSSIIVPDSTASTQLESILKHIISNSESSSSGHSMNESLVEQVHLISSEREIANILLNKVKKGSGSKEIIKTIEDIASKITLTEPSKLVNLI